MLENDPQYVKDLLKYLVEFPEKFNYRYTTNAATDLRRALFRAASVNGKYIGNFFPELATDSQSVVDGNSTDDDFTIKDEEVEIQDSLPNRKKRKSTERNWIMSEKDPNNIDPSHPGRPCVRKFKKGEPTYRCLTCGLDDTCVLCQYCYNPEDHVDHQVTVQISQKDCGGVCDCGDPEAWVKQFSCKYHSLDNYENKPIPDELYAATKRTIEIAIDYMIDIFCNGHIGIQKFTTTEEVLMNEQESKLSSEVYGVEDNMTNGKYVLCLWNDQKHSFTDALNVILGATQKTIEFGKMITRRIDSVGRAIVIVSDNLPKLMEKKAKMERTGLVNTVRSSKDHVREEMCATICYWLDDLSKSSLKNNYFVLRAIIGEVLCESWTYGTDRLRRETGSTTSSNINNDSNNPVDSNLIRLHSSLDGPYIPDISKRTKRTSHVHINNPDEDEDEEDGEIYDDAEEEFIDRVDEEEEREEFIIYDNQNNEMYLEGDGGNGEGDGSGSRNNSISIVNHSSSSKVWQNAGPVPPPPYGPSFDSSGVRKINSRVQYLIFFDIRLWKDLRLTLRDLYVTVLVSNLECKTLLGHFYAQLYPQIAELYMLADREPECSIISSLSTQLFTTPTIATDLLRYDYFTRLIAALYTFFTTGEVGPPTAIDPQGFINPESKVLRNRRFGQLFHDVEYLLNRNTEKDLVSGDVDRMAQVAELMLLFQGMSPLRRQVDKHVEYESETWIYFFNAIPYVVQLAMVVASGISSCKNKQKCFESISEVVGVTCLWALGSYSKRFKLSEITSNSRPLFISQNVKYADRIVSIENIDFKVENQWVSLHHPLHSYLSWLIQYSNFDDAQTLRQVLLKGIKNANVTPISEEENLLQLIFEHPIRVLSLLSQIHIGVWVRNGYSVRSQLHHYREFTLRDSAFLRDVIMAQTALVVLRPNTSIMQLLTRFSLLNWQYSELFDSSQRGYMLEEFLHHLIFFVMERTQLTGLPEKEVRKKYLIKEIIQCLSFRDMAFSDIAKILPDYLANDEMFETVLREVAIYKSPSGVRDYGLYQLKQEYYKQFDTHYIHFSSAKIEEAESIIKNKIHKLTGKSLESIVHEPPLEQISGPYQHLAAFSRTVPFGRFIYDLLHYIIINTNENENINEGLLGQLLQLLHVLALDDLLPKDEQPFQTSFSSLAELVITETSENNYYPCILSLLCQLLKLNEFNNYEAKVRRILQLFSQKNPALIDPFINSAFGNDLFTRDTTPHDDYGMEKKKKLGQERKAQILAEFQNRQKQFAQMNLTDDMDLDDDDEKVDYPDNSNGWSFPESQCILCRMPDDNKPGNSNVFGLMGYVMHTNVVRNIPFDNADWVYEGFGNEKNLDEDISINDIDNNGNDNWKRYRKELHENCNIGPGFPPKYANRAAIMTGCGHGVHFQCYQDYLKSTRNRGQQLTRNNPEDTSRAEYLCPLCRALNNTFLPILWKSNKRSAGDFLKIADIEANNNFIQLLRNNTFEEDITIENYHDRIFQDGCTNLIPSYAQLMSMGTNNIPDTKLDKAISEPIQRIYQAGLDQEYHPDPPYIDELNGMVECFAETISSLEVSLRGKGYSNPMGGIIMDQIPAQSLQIIRVFGELCKTYIAYSVTLSKNENIDNYVNSRHPNLTRDTSYRLRNPLDTSHIVSFQDFVSSALLTGPANGIEVGPILKSYCTATITHILTTLIKQIARKSDWVWNEKIFDLPIGKSNEIDINDPETIKTIESLIKIINSIRPHIETTHDQSLDLLWSKQEFIQIIYSILRKCLAPFLRKCAIFIFALCGNYDPYDFMGFGKDFPEIDKLCEYLGLESIGSMLKAITSNNGLEAMIFDNYSTNGFTMFANELEYPSVIRLLRLPERLDDFFNLRNNKSLVGKLSSDIVPDPAVCLFCGASVGMQVPAFERDRTTGQCHEHVNQCSKDIGIFLLPKRSSMLLLKGQQGSFSEGPYLDVHGEADETMRRGRPQFLQQNRYDHFIRSMWQQHGIPNYIARKLDSVIDNGGWETL